jgi:hypothetical protein
LSESKFVRFYNEKEKKYVGIAHNCKKLCLILAAIVVMSQALAMPRQLCKLLSAIPLEESTFLKAYLP